MMSDTDWLAKLTDEDIAERLAKAFGWRLKKFRLGVEAGKMWLDSKRQEMYRQPFWRPTQSITQAFVVMEEIERPPKGRRGK